MICCGCGTKFDFDTPGVIIKTISADVSPKSGRPIPQEDFFPDGRSEKFICASCLFETEAARMLGFYDQAEVTDFPMEVKLSESTHVPSMSAAYLPWTESYKP